MWKRILDTEYFLLNDKYSKVFVTNYISVWFINFSDESFATCLRESNLGLQMPEKEMLEKGKILLSNPSDLKSVKESKNGNTLVLSLIKSFGYPFRLQLKLAEGSKELFFQQITLTLFRTVKDLRSSEVELKRLLLKKDQEIEEYKCEGGEIALRHLKTVPFNEEGHLVKHTVFHENFGADEVPHCLLSKTVDVPEERIKPELTHANDIGLNIKVEPKTEVKLENHSSSILPQVTVKNEPSSQPTLTVLKTEAGASPSKRLRKKLNL